MINIWALIEANRFDDASAIAEMEYSNTGDISYLRNRVFALMHLKQYQTVIELSDKIIQLTNSSTDSDFIFKGIALWLLKKYGEAVDVWQNGTTCKYSDVSGGVEIQVFIYYAATKLCDDKLKFDSQKAISKLLRNKNAFNWPGPLGLFLIDKLTVQEIKKLVSSNEILEQRQQCQVHFVKAIKYLESNSQQLYLQELINCVNLGVSAYLEFVFYLAMGELESMTSNSKGA